MTEPAIYGLDLFGEPLKPASRGPLADEFVVPPFSVFDARQGFWQERKRAWLSLGIQSELGRTAATYAIGDKAEWDASKTAVSQRLAPGGGGGGCLIGGPKTDSTEKFTKGNKLGFSSTITDMGRAASTDAGTSVFDPVLCELAYRWFCPTAGLVLDPFAGGSVRGIVAALLGRRYYGIDLSAGQLEANREQAEAICPEAARLEWHAGDAADLLPEAPEADFIFSCPPYGDLERYSDDPVDLSTMEWHTFCANYKRIIMRAAKRLKPNRFACFVVGNYRGRDGCYRDLVGATIAGFADQGMALYNDAVLVTAVGSLPIRVGKQFRSGRKLGKTHQNALVFVKGDWRKAAKAAS
ncbi:MAG TPA: class I SAM-dependent methyltransferase [Phycisphaerae bacterium]|nr:class I SAM-dependent methyltransferase [Phycisphaerae bacterium]